MNEYMSRRRQDVMDQAQELAPTTQSQYMLHNIYLVVLFKHKASMVCT